MTSVRQCTVIGIVSGFMLAGGGLLSTASAQDLRDELDNVFVDVLETSLQVSPGQHKNHFLPERVASSQRTILSLGNFIGTNVSSFPLSSTSTGLTFDFSTGVPVPTMTSSGPVFAERARTLGKQKLNVGANVSALNLSRLRGVNTEDVTATLFHENVGDTSVFGDQPFEYDYITLDMNLDLNAVVFATYATYGLTDRIDVGIAIPIVSVTMTGSPRAQMNSFTFASDGSAAHHFEGTREDPTLTHDSPAIDASSTGIGDIALRAKGNFFQSVDGDFGGLVEVRLPTGDEKNFLGTGDASVKLMLIASKSFSGFSPHVNLAYDIRMSDLDRDEIELTLGYDHKISDALTIAAEWIGEFETGDQIAATSFPGPTVIKPAGADNPTYEIPSTSIPSYSADNIINASFGMKYSPTPNLLLIANVIFPINNGGLRSDVIPTVGLEFSL